MTNERYNEQIRANLFSRLATPNQVDVSEEEVLNLSRLVTFVEQPTLSRHSNKSSIPQPHSHNSKHVRYLLTKETSLQSSKQESRLVLPKIAATSTRPSQETEPTERNEPPIFRSSYSSKFRSVTPKRLTSFRSTASNTSQLLISNQRPLVGGTPIQYEQAVALRKLVNGSLMFSFGKAWRVAVFTFKEGLKGYHPYGLLANRDGTRGLVLCVQAFLLKNLLFSRLNTFEGAYSELLRCSEYQRKECLMEALCDILWQAGNSRRASFVLPSSYDYIQSNRDYKADGITEKLHIFDFHSCNDLMRFIRKYFQYLETPNNYGCILFLYSVIFSRTLAVMQSELLFDNAEQESLLQANESLTQFGINLLLTGKACKYLHNGVILYDQEGELLITPKIGLSCRSMIGFLHWDKSWLDEDKLDDRDLESIRIGSMLKTPKFPIWLTRVNNQLGVLFCTNLELVSNWKSEHRFLLNYYTGLASQNKECRLNIDTFQPRSARMRRTRNKQVELEEQKKIPPLEQCILTKWFGAHIKWNNCMPTY